MPIIYKFDILAALKEKGYNTSKLRKEKLLAEGVIQSLREDKAISFSNLDKLCEFLECQPGDLLEYVKDDIYAKLGFSRMEKSEIRKLVQFIPDSKVDELLPSLIELIRTEDWYDLSEDERRERLRKVLKYY